MHLLSGGDAPSRAWPHIAFVHCPFPKQAYDEDWLDACYRLTPRVERVDASRALLDLGICTDEEAEAAVRGLLVWLKAHGGRARAGIGKSAVLAQCALLAARREQTLTQVTADAVSSFLRDIPVAVLTRLHPAGRIMPEVVERLQHYGLSTFAHVARIGEPALHRHFSSAGAALAAITRGEDPTPIRPTSPPDWLLLRLRLNVPEPPERIVAALPAFAERASARLRLRGQRTRILRLRVSWESGGVQSIRLSLRTHTDDARILAAELRRALDSLLACTTDTSPSDRHACLRAFEDLHVGLGDLASVYPEQSALWQTPAMRRREILKHVEEGLARRHGRAVLLTPIRHATDAIFTEDRYRLAGLLASEVDGLAPAEADVAHGMKKTAAKAMPPVTAGDPWREVPQRLHWW